MEASLGEPDLQTGETLCFLTDVLLVVETSEKSVLEAADGDESSDTFLLLLFLVVGSIGSHLTRAAFVERLASVVLFRL